MRKTDPIQETRLSVRLQGPLAAHANRQVETSLYNSHSEYIRDLVRRDMGHGEDAELEASIMRGLSDLDQGLYTSWDSKTSLRQAQAHASKHKK